MTEREELKACPFCGGTDKDATLGLSHAGKYVYHADTGDCEAFRGALISVRVWNRRAEG